MKKITMLSVLASTSILFFSFTGIAQAAPGWGHGWGNKRLYGANRFSTSTQIAQNLYQNKLQNVVITSGNEYADALSASVLAKKLNAPIILVSNSLDNSNDSLNYIESNLAPGGNVYIIGGDGVVPEFFTKKFRDLRCKVNRLGGRDRYQTNSLIVNQLNVPINTPIILASGNDFPDALGISSVAASKGWPILLVDKNNMASTVQTFIKNDQPSQVYVVGGTGVISSKVDSIVQELAPSTTITRLSGVDRFATLAVILDTFFPHPSQIYVANGYRFADALAGSPLAANGNAPILLVDPNSKELPPAVVTYLLQLRAAGVQPQITSLGGTGIVPDALLQQIASYLGEQSTSTTAQSDSISGTIQSTSTNSSVVTINLNDPSTYAGAAQYRVYVNGNPVSSLTTIGTATTVDEVLYSGRTVQVKFFNANGVQVGADAYVVLNRTTVQADSISSTIQSTSTNSSVVTINLNNPSTYAGAAQYRVYVNGNPVSSLTTIGTATTVNEVLYSGSTVQVKFFNANGVQVGADAYVVCNGATIQADSISGTIQSTSTNSSVVMINLINPSTYAGAVQYRVYVSGNPVSSLTSIGAATSVNEVLYSGSTVQVKFFNANGVQVGADAYVVLNRTTVQADSISSTIQSTSTNSSVVTINLNNPSTYAGAAQYRVYVNGNPVSSLTTIGTATIVNEVLYSDRTVQVKFFNANGVQVGADAYVVCNGATIQADSISGTIQSTSTNSSVVTINLNNPSTYAGAAQYRVYVSGNPVSSLTSIGAATSVIQALYSNSTVQVEFFNANGVQVGPVTNVVLNSITS